MINLNIINRSISLYAGLDQEIAMMSSHSLEIDGTKFSIKPSKFSDFIEIKEFLSVESINNLLHNIEAIKSEYGYFSSNGNKLLFDFYNDNSHKYLVVVSAGETQPMLFKVDVEGIWIVNN